MAQEGKTLPANEGTLETQVPSLGREDPQEKGMAAHSGISFPWRIPQTEEACWATVHGVAQSRTRLSDEHVMHQKNVQGLVTPSLNPIGQSPQYPFLALRLAEHMYEENALR